jgi:hypothetical protein
MAKFPDSRIDALSLSSQTNESSDCPSSVVTPSPPRGLVSLALRDVANAPRIKNQARTKTQAPGPKDDARALPAYSGGTVWASYPLRMAAGAASSCRAGSITRAAGACRRAEQPENQWKTRVGCLWRAFLLNIQRRCSVSHQRATLGLTAPTAPYTEPTTEEDA